MKRERQLRKSPPRPAIRLVPPEPPRHLAFPGGVGDAPELPQPVSHVARRRVSSAPAHEVELDELELLDESNDGIRALATPAGAPSWQPPSIAPLAMDSPPASAPSPPLSASRGSRRGAVATAVTFALLGLGVAAGALVHAGGAAARGGGQRISDPVGAAAAAPQVSPSTATPRAEPPSTVAVVDVATLPRSHEGTILGAHGHRLWVDGHLEDGFTAVAACGRHVVQVGSAGTPHDVNVPCGDTVTVSP